MQASKNVLFDTYRSQITQALTQELRLTSSDSAPEITLELPPDPKMGDFAFPTFRLAKELKKAPPLIAKELAAKINSQIKNIDVQALGPYINFTVDKQALTGDVLASLLLSQNKLGEKQMAIAPTVIMEFSSPNVAKPFNIYHLRSTMIGNCLYRILAARGFDPVAINHLGDWGSQYGTLAVAYEMWGDDQELEKRGIEYLVELYVRINKLMEEDSSLKEKTRQYFARLEKGDPQIQAVWKKFVDLSLKEFQKTYARLHVKFDHFWGESFYIDKVQSLEKKLEDSKLLIESEGAYIVPLEAYNMPPCIVRKTDGSTIYATRDLAAAIYRHERFAFSKMVYVVGGEQKLHFAQVFKVLELLNFKWAKDCVHVDFGLYRFGDQKMSTRKGIL